MPGFSLSVPDEEIVKRLDSKRSAGGRGWEEWYAEFKRVRGGALLSDRWTLRLARELARLEKEVFE